MLKWKSIRCKCRPYGEKKTINDIERKDRKLAQKEYKTKHDWVGMLIH